MLKEGPLSIEVVARYLDYNSVSTKLDYTVYKNKEITFSILNDPTYLVTSEGIKNREYIEIEAKVDGNKVSSSQWDSMDIPQIELSNENLDFSIANPVIEKTEKVGVYRIYPVLPNEGPSTGTYIDCDYSITYQQKFGSETWSGTMHGVLKLNDTRNWFERNWDLIILIIIMLIIIFITVGYLPFVKHYLPKSLKKKPFIKCVPDELGEQNKIRSGRIDKNLISTLIPYKSQTGVIKYVPKGVTGAPPLNVKAIKRRRMTLINIKDFVGKDYIAFDNETIKKDHKKFNFSASVTIRVKRRGWTYFCNPNQSNSKN